MFNYNQLRNFYVFATEESVSKAAQILHISQPALSTQLRNLQSSIGRQLYVTKGRRVSLTPDGEVVFRYAADVFSICEDLSYAVKAGILVSADRIQIGVSDVFEESVAFDFVRNVQCGGLMLTRPKVTFHSVPFGTVVHKLKSGAIDVAIISQVPAMHGLKILGESDLSFKFVVSAGLPQTIFPSGYENIGQALEAFSKHRSSLVLPPRGTHLRSRIDRVFEKYDFEPNVAFESEKYHTLARAIEAGFGVGILPSEYLSSVFKGMKLREIATDEALLRIKAHLVVRSESIRKLNLAGNT